MNEYDLGALFRVALLVLILPIAVLNAVAASVGADPTYTVVCIVTTAVYLVAIAPAVLRDRYDIFEPYTVLILSILIGIVLRTAYVQLTGNDSLRDFLLIGHPASTLLPGALACLLGCSALALGYATGRGSSVLARQEMFLTNAWSRDRLRLVVAACVAIGTLSFWLFMREFQTEIVLEQLGDVSSKRFGKISGSEFRTAFGYWRWGVSLLAVAVLLLLVSIATERRRASIVAWLALAAIGVLSLGFPVYTSSRMEFVTQIGMFVAALLYVRGRIPTRAVVLVPMATLVLFMAVTGLRSKVETGRDLVSYLTRVPLIEETVGSRFFIDVVRTSLIMEHYPEEAPHHYGRSYVSALVAPVPRSLWPGKPAIGLGKEVGREVYGLQYSGVPPGVLGELWINFGWWMIMPGMWLYGYVLRAFYETFRPVLHLRNGAICYAVALLPMSYTLQGDFSVGILDLATTLLPVVACVWFVTLSRADLARCRRFGAV